MKSANLTELLSKPEVAAQGGSVCPGQYYRYLESAYKTNTGFATTRELRLLKRISCVGCETCVPIVDDVQEGIASSGRNYLEFSADLNPGDIVRLEIVEDSRDWESGLCEDWHSRVVRAAQFLPTQEQLSSLPSTSRGKVRELMMGRGISFAEASALVLKS